MIITQTSTLERLEDQEIRSEYGSETLKYDVAAALVEARKIKNLTQVELASIAGVSQAYIAKLESGEANPTIGRIGAILASMWLKTRINLVHLKQSSEDYLDEFPPVLKTAAIREERKSQETPLFTSESSQRNNVISLQRYLGLRNNTMREKSDEVISCLAR